MEMIRSLAPVAGSVLGNMLLPGIGGALGGGLVGALLGGGGGGVLPGGGGDQAEFKKILDTIMGSGDYTGLSAEADRAIGQGSRALTGAMAYRGLHGSSLEKDALSGLIADIQGRLAQSINQDKLSRAQLAMGLYGNLLGAKSAASAADASMWGGLGGVAGTVFGSDWFNKWLTSKLNAPAPSFGGGNSGGGGFGIRYQGQTVDVPRE